VNQGKRQKAKVKNVNSEVGFFHAWCLLIDSDEIVSAGRAGQLRAQAAPGHETM